MAITLHRPDRFITLEVQEASGLQPAAVANLVKLGLTSSEGGGKGITRLWDAEGLAHLIVCGGFYSAGLELFPAALVARAVCNEWTDWGRPLPDNLQRFHQAGSGDLYSRFVATGLACEDNGTYGSVLRPARLDSMICIVDREFVYERQLDGTRFMMARDPGEDGAERQTEQSTEARGLFRISNRQRGEVDPVVERAAQGQDSEQALADLDREFHQRWTDRVATLELNLSLCLRRGCAAIFDLRRKYSPDGKGWVFR